MQAGEGYFMEIPNNKANEMILRVQSGFFKILNKPSTQSFRISVFNRASTIDKWFRLIIGFCFLIFLWHVVRLVYLKQPFLIDWNNSMTYGMAFSGMIAIFIFMWILVSGKLLPLQLCQTVSQTLLLRKGDTISIQSNDIRKEYRCIFLGMETKKVGDYIEKMAEKDLGFSHINVFNPRRYYVDLGVGLYARVPSTAISCINNYSEDKV